MPDALFGLRFNDETESYFMLEIDRGEMPIERYKNMQRTYFAKKMLTYYEANRQQRHVHDLGIENFRVLTVTTDGPRIKKCWGRSMPLLMARAQIYFCLPIKLRWRTAVRWKLNG